MVNRLKISNYRAEIENELYALAQPSLDKRKEVQRIKGTKYSNLGIRVPIIKKLIKSKYAFRDLNEEVALQIWDSVWNESDIFDLMSMALFYYRGLKSQSVWKHYPIFFAWKNKIDNWDHADNLAYIFSRIVDTDRSFLSQLKELNNSDNFWERRISIVSLIHYSGKNSVYLPPAIVFPFIDKLLGDSNEYVAKSIAWVLREMTRKYPIEVKNFISNNEDRLTKGITKESLRYL